MSAVLVAVKHGSRPAKPGRPAYVPSDKDRELVRLLCAGGITHDRIAKVMGIGESTLERHFRDDIAAGQTEIDVLSVSTLVTAMKEGGKDGLTAAIWWQKARMGWSERTVIDTNAAPLRVTVELVGDAPPADKTVPRGSWNSGPDVKFLGDLN